MPKKLRLNNPVGGGEGDQKKSRPGQFLQNPGDQANIRIGSDSEEQSHNFSKKRGKLALWKG